MQLEGSKVMPPEHPDAEYDNYEDDFEDYTTSEAHSSASLKSEVKKDTALP
jgi:hypothetical protein